jgi:hypothetical protein
MLAADPHDGPNLNGEIIMSTWDVIRRADNTDIENLNRAADRFCRRHGIDTDGSTALTAVENAVAYEDYNHDRGKARPLRANWARIVHRILGDNRAEGIFSGTVGYSI